MLLAQAGDLTNYGELILKLVGAALPVIGGGFALVQSLRRQPQTADAPKISVVVISHDALTAPEALKQKPQNQGWGERLVARLSFQFIAGALYAAVGFIDSDPVFGLLGGVLLAGAFVRLVWRILLRSFGDVTTDCVEMSSVIAGDVDEIIDTCVDAVQRLKGRITGMNRDERAIDAVSNRGASMALIVVPEAVERRALWRRRSAPPGRYRLHIRIQSATPDAWTAARNLRLARKLIEHVTGVRWRRPAPQ